MSVTAAQKLRWNKRIEAAWSHIDDADSELRRALRMFQRTERGEFPVSPHVIDAIGFVEAALGCLRGALRLGIESSESISLAAGLPTTPITRPRPTTDKGEEG